MPSTVNEVVRLIAQIGGFLGRKGDGEPSAKTIWRGPDQVLAAAETLRALRDGPGWLVYKGMALCSHEKWTLPSNEVNIIIIKLNIF